MGLWRGGESPSQTRSGRVWLVHFYIRTKIFTRNRNQIETSQTNCKNCAQQTAYETFKQKQRRHRIEELIILIKYSNNELPSTIKQNIWVQTLGKVRLLHRRIITQKPLIGCHIQDKTSIMSIQEGTRVVYN